ncbi:MAG: hypothetical protein HYX68_21430 [Planctomycetes bacterium]|nr:hypothetical protein [Planctomycetota bacterium]
MYDRFTDRARKVMQLAHAEAQRLNHEYVGTEHVLLGLITEGTGVATNVFNNLGIELPMVHDEIVTICPPALDPVILGKLPQTPRCKQALVYAVEESGRLGNHFVDSEHLLLGVLRTGDSVGAQVLMAFGGGLEAVWREIHKVLGAECETPINPFPQPFKGDSAETMKLLAEGAGGIPIELCIALPAVLAIVEEFDNQIRLIWEQIEEAIATEEREAAADLQELKDKLGRLRDDFIRQ